MNWDIIKGNWNQMKGEIQQQWGKLTDDDIARADGDREKLKGILQERYGDSKEAADEKIDEFLKKVA